MSNKEEELKKEIESHYYSNSSGDELACYCEECKRKASELKGIQIGKAEAQQEIVNKIEMTFPFLWGDWDSDGVNMVSKDNFEKWLQELKEK